MVTLPQICFVVGDKFDEDYFLEVREKKLIAMLSYNVIEEERTWLRYDMEETEVCLDISDMIIDQLVEEIMSIYLNASSTV